LTFLILFEAVVYTATTPRPQEKFFELYVLGLNKSANGYYPNNSSFIVIREPVTWYVAVHNQMGSIQFIDLRLKLGNQTINPPNDTTASPSSAPLVTEFKGFIPDNGTWEFPFVWQVLNYTKASGGHSHVELLIGNATYFLQNAPGCSSLSSCKFRFIFELWTWNIESDSFQMGWWSGDQQEIAWLQLWFNLTPGAH
jgi:hypothetical protein